MLLCGLLLGIATAEPSLAQDTLVAAGASWRYLDNGSNQGVAWRNPGFADGAWASGSAQLGYGDGDEATVVGFGPSAANKFITTYFRHSFPVTSAAAYLGLSLRLLRDDGAVVYLNGVEIARSNMPAGAIGYTTPASAAVGGADESTFQLIPLSPGPLVDGTNVLAVEIHQSSAGSSDLSFDLRLIGDTSATVGRGPYLQIGNSSGMTVRWRTNVATDGRVRYGSSPSLLNQSADDANFGTEHEVSISSLSPGTRYYYSVGTTAALLAGGTSDYFFTTSPAEGTAPPTRVWVIGDSGTANANAAAVRDDYLAFTGAVPTDAWLMLGDNAYPTGTDAAYQAAVFDTYPTLLRNTVLWPSLGNHDAEPGGVSMSNGSGPYFDMFTLPTAAESGGTPSGTEAYFSFDYGNIHFINLNSTGSDRSPGGAILSWLESDLATTTKPWIIAFWHHPPYTKGSHDSDNSGDSEGRMFDMREFALPILEAGGVDLVLTGHSHSYERSFLVRGH